MSAPDYLYYIERHFSWIAMGAVDIIRHAESALYYSRRVNMPDFETRAEDQINRAEAALKKALADLQEVRANLRPVKVMEAAE